MFIKRALKVFFIGIAAFALATVAYAYAASNTFDSIPLAGDGSGTISGYNVSSVTYTLDSNNPASITAVAFDLDAAATTVRVGLVDGGSLFNCSTGGGNHWTCAITGVTVNAADELTVIAAQ